MGQHAGLDPHPGGGFGADNAGYAIRATTSRSTGRDGSAER